MTARLHERALSLPTDVEEERIMCNVVVVSAEELAALVEAVVRRALDQRASIEASEWVDARGAAALLGVSSRQIAKLAQRGELPCARVGKLLRFRRSDVLA